MALLKYNEENLFNFLFFCCFFEGLKIRVKKKRIRASPRDYENSIPKI